MSKENRQKTLMVFRWLAGFIIAGLVIFRVHQVGDDPVTIKSLFWVPAFLYGVWLMWSSKFAGAPLIEIKNITKTE